MQLDALKINGDRADSTPNGAASSWRLLRDVAAIAVRDLAELTVLGNKKWDTNFGTGTLAVQNEM